MKFSMFFGGNKDFKYTHLHSLPFGHVHSRPMALLLSSTSP
uniref:Uncharacterized protein n=1 Tax=Rhizophora mucronata TaxID=61149 RepID=A0A2P2M4N1_RHIMU